MKLRKFNYLNTSFSPVVLYNFNNTINDSSGNGYHLTLAAGDERYVTINNFTGFYFSGVEYLTKASEDSFINFGAITIEAIIILPGTTGATLPTGNTIIIFGGNTELSSGNQAWGLISANPTGTNSGNRLHYFVEYGNGTNITYTSAANLPVGQICHAALTRDSTGTVIKLYVNGKLFDTSGTLTAPNNTTSGILTVGADVTGNTELLNGTILFSIKVINSQLTDAQIANEYNKTLGSVYGII